MTLQNQWISLPTNFKGLFVRGGTFDAGAMFFLYYKIFETQHKHTFFSHLTNSKQYFPQMSYTKQLLFYVFITYFS